MVKIEYILKKDLPTIMAGRVIELSKDGSYGTPKMMNIEEKSCVHYVFPISILESEKDWFELFEFDSSLKFEMN